MADHVRKQIRDAVAAALTGLVTSGANVFPSRTHELQDDQLPGLRIYTNNQSVEADDVTIDPVEESEIELVVEACSKKSADLDDELDQMAKEVQAALAANQTAGGAKSIALRSIEVDMEGEAEKEVGLARLTFVVSFFSARGAPDVAL